MDKRITKRIIIGIVSFLVVLVLAQLVFAVNVYLEKKSNHEKVLRFVDEDLMYRWDTMDSDLEYIQDWIDKGRFNNEDIGRLYERASLIYMQKGEIIPYYRYLGYALYYLERSTDKDYTVNVYLDLANFFMNNYADESAQKMIESAQNVEDFDDIEDVQIKSYAYRMLAIVAIMDEDYDKAETLLNKAQEAIVFSDTNTFEECYRAINDTYIARVFFETGRVDECKKKLEYWEGNEMFTQDIYREILLRDLIIPYYQVKCMVISSEVYADKDNLSPEELNKRDMEVSDVYGEFVSLCEESGYEKTELGTLLDLQNKYPPLSDDGNKLLLSQIKSLYGKLFEKQNADYATIIDSTVSDSMEEMWKSELDSKDRARRIRAIATSVSVALVVLAVMMIIILNSRVDGLTGLLNRKAFNRMLARAKRRKVEYGIIMIDIDFFKRINDTYGHQNGDLVLETLGNLIRTEITPDVHCFRYGGEEFVILLDKKALSYGRAVAERLRFAMEHRTWPFGDKTVVTISAGLATGCGDTDVLKQADDNLYHSKENGRNQVTATG